MLQKIEHYFSPRRAWIRFFFIISGIGILFWQWISTLYQTENPKILFLIDNSLSMTVQDVARKNDDGFLSRLAIATDFLQSFSTKIPNEIGVMTFARYATLELPFSTDRQLLKNTLSGISPIIYGGGSNLEESLQLAKNLYQDVDNIHIILFTDAEFFEEISKDFSLPASWKMFFVGIGTEKWGVMLQGYDANGKPRYREFEGKNAISKFSLESLQKLSKIFSASYFVLDHEKNLEVVSKKLEEIIITQSEFSHFSISKLIAYLLIISGFFITNYPYKKYNFRIWKEKA